MEVIFTKTLRNYSILEIYGRVVIFDEQFRTNPGFRVLSIVLSLEKSNRTKVDEYKEGVSTLYKRKLELSFPKYILVNDFICEPNN